jgi:hypothetical protein
MGVGMDGMASVPFLLLGKLFKKSKNTPACADTGQII